MNDTWSDQKRLTEGRLRYRLYFWLMDASLVGVVIFFASVLFQAATGLEFFGLPPMLGLVSGVVLMALIFLIPLILIIGRPLRDEYAEILWRRTIAPLVVIMSTSPLLYIVIGWTLYAAQIDPKSSAALAWLYEQQSGFEAISGAWALLNMLFVAIFQFLRWRDSR